MHEKLIRIWDTTSVGSPDRILLLLFKCKIQIHNWTGIRSKRWSVDFTSQMKIPECDEHWQSTDCLTPNSLDSPEMWDELRFGCKSILTHYFLFLISSMSDFDESTNDKCWFFSFWHFCPSFDCCTNENTFVEPFEMISSSITNYTK